MNRPRKTCSCGRSWSWQEWRTLPLAGTMVFEEVALELRNCSCGSTISVSQRPSDVHQARALAAREKATKLRNEARLLVARAGSIAAIRLKNTG